MASLILPLLFLNNSPLIILLLAIFSGLWRPRNAIGNFSNIKRMHIIRLVLSTKPCNCRRLRRWCRRHSAALSGHGASNTDYTRFWRWPCCGLVSFGIRWYLLWWRRRC